MLIQVLKSKIHLAKVTDCLLNYQGSCAIDVDWLKEVGIRPNEQIHILNQNNGERFITYAIEAPAGSKAISINGAAARKAAVGDRVIIVAYGMIESREDIPPPKILSF